MPDSDWNEKWAILRDLCANGNAEVPRGSLEKASTERDYCRICAAHHPAIDALIKLFDLREYFAEAAPNPPSSEPQGAEQYIGDCLRLLTEEVERRGCDPRAMAFSVMRDLGTHFSAKLVHTDAKIAPLRASKRPTSLPHLSSRRLLANGVVIPIDYIRLDDGKFKRVAKIHEGDETFSRHLPSSIVDAIRAGAEEAMSPKAGADAAFVDHRLRQVLLPTADGEYMAASPLPSGGIAMLIDRAVNGRHLHRLERITMEIGGGYVRNACRFPASVIQAPWYCPTPQRERRVVAIWKFVFQPWRPFVSDDEARKVNGEIAALGLAASWSAVEAQVEGALARLTRKCHSKALRMGEMLRVSSYRENGEEIPIDEELLRAKRKREPSVLDLALVTGRYGAEYRRAMAETLVDILRRKPTSKHEELDRHPLDAEEARRRVRETVVRILEGR